MEHPGQLSPGRLELLTSPVERCRSRPAHPRPGRARLHYVEREDPGDGRRRNRGTAIITPLPAFIMRPLALPYHAYAMPASPVVRTPRPRTVTTINARLTPYRLTTSSYAGVP